jgi:DNA-binding HxlR family transcriptional regulator
MSDSNDAFIPGCPVRFAAGIFGDRWTMILLRDLLFRGRNRYGQLLENGEGISTNILADRLAKLEAQGLVTRDPDPDNGTRVLYTPTHKAIGLIPVFLAIMEWGLETDPDCGLTPEGLAELRQREAALSRSLARRARA